MNLRILLMIYFMSLCDKYVRGEFTNLLRSGFQDIQRETIDGVVTVEYGTIPRWLSGNFIRHSCGVFGETDYENVSLPNYIDHLFDCLEIGSKFKLANGIVTFTNRWYDTVVNDIYSHYERNMNLSSVFIPSTFAQVNPSQVDKWQSNLSDPSKMAQVPHVSWWQIGKEAIAMTEMPIGVIVDPNNVVHRGYIMYNDSNMGYSDSVFFLNNPAHEHMETDGTLWSAVSACEFVTETRVKSWRIVYKVNDDKVRHVIGEYHYDEADLTKCSDNSTYPSFGARFGYLHSFSITENFIILPEAGYMFDPCALNRYDMYKPFFPHHFNFESNAFSRLLVMRKSDGHFIANITVPPFFVTHQLGAYETNNFIVMDMLMYQDSSIYDRHTYIDNILGEEPYTTNVSRITINMENWTATIKSLRKPDVAPAAFEMSNINYAYNGKKYTYGYMARNFDQKFQNALTKINVDTGDEIEYKLPEGMFVQEPLFVATPGSSAEDDGVLIAQGVDGRKRKAFMIVVDAKTMTLLGHVTAPDIALFGLHNRFFSLDIGTTTVNAANKVGVFLLEFIACVLLSALIVM